MTVLVQEALRCRYSRWLNVRTPRGSGRTGSASDIEESPGGSAPGLLTKRDDTLLGGPDTSTESLVTPVNSPESNTPPQIPQVLPQFRTLDLVEAQIRGWDRHVGISPSQSLVLRWIAKRGLLHEPGMAFAWFPYHGLAWWAASMAMSETALQTALWRLRKKQLLVTLHGSRIYPRYRRTRGYAIPLPVMVKAIQWAADREEMSRAFNDEITPCDLDGASGSHGVISEITGCDNESPTDLLPQGLSGSNPRGTNPGERDTHRLTSEIRPPGVSQPDPQELPLEDQWAAPSDEADTWAAPKKEKLARTKKPTTVILDHFEDCCLRAREQRPDLAFPWPNKVIPASNLKAWMKKEPDLDVATIIALVDQFFSWGVGLRGVTLNQETLWKDFWYARPALWRRVRQRTSSVSRDTTARNAAILRKESST